MNLKSISEQLSQGQICLEDDSLLPQIRSEAPGFFERFETNNNHPPPARIKIIDAKPEGDSHSRPLVVNGKAQFSAENPNDLADVLATFEQSGNGDSSFVATIRYALPESWRFIHTFCYLPPQSGGIDSALDTLSLSAPYVYLTTRDHTHVVDKNRTLELKRGLNFSAKYNPDAILAFLGDLLQKPAGTAQYVLQGRLVCEGEPTRLREDEFPWDPKDSVPGLYAEATLVTDVTIAQNLALRNVRMRVYTPSRWGWLDDNPASAPLLARYQPVIAYVAEIWHDSQKLLTVFLTDRPDADELTIGGKFAELKLQLFLNALKSIGIPDDPLSIIPNDIKKVLDDIRNVLAALELRSASISISRDEKSLVIRALRFTIGISPSIEQVKIFDRIKARFKSLTITIANPFSSEQRSFYVTIEGETEAFGLELALRAEFPVFSITATQIGDTPVDLNKLYDHFNLSGLPRAPEFALKALTLVVQPPDTYLFSVAIDPEKTWQLRGKSKPYSLPNVRLLISNNGWEFGAGTDGAEEGFPIAAVLYEMVQQREDLCKHFENIEVPEALNSFTVDYLSLSCDSSKQFALVCDGSFRNGTPGVGQITVRARVSVSKGENTAFLAAVNPQGVPLGNLVRAISPAAGGIADFVPQGFNLEVKNALFAFVTGEPSKCLFAIDFGVDIDLAKAISKFDFLKTASITLGRVGFEDLQILVANEEFTSHDVDELNALLPRAFRRIPVATDGTSAAAGKQKALQKGVNFSGKLLLPGGAMPLQMPAELAPATTTGATTQPVVPETDAPATKWFEIQKSLGPLYLGRIGLQYQSTKKTVNFLLDASVELLGLRLALMGLRLGLNIEKVGKFSEFGLQELLEQGLLTAGLDGLEISVQRGPVTISGGLLLLPDGGFVGSVLIKSEVFSLFGLGAYKNLETPGAAASQPSLFVFAVLDKDLGGPPCFHVTGLAFGFGYNQKLTLPSIEGVAECGLVKAAIKPEPKDLLATALTISQEVSTPAVGEYWLAAGVKFTSFEMIQSFALLTISFGSETVITITGLSKITVPAKLGEASKGVPIIACAELAFKVSFRPESGVLAAEAQLTANSYIFSEGCKLSGGFAFYAWFKDIRDPKVANKKISAGDFVVSLGGYHPKFNRPEHYPIVPRLKLDWKQSDKLQIMGEVYFALTPSCLMLGGRLSAVFQDQGLRAWFVAYADFIIAWQPLAYEARIGVRIGVAYAGTIAGIAVNFGIELSAQLQLLGPPLWGKAEIQCTFISFTIEFGKKPQPQPLKWAEFKRALLPEDSQSLTITVVSGLVKEFEGTEPKTTLAVVNPYQVRILVKSAVPAKDATIAGKWQDAGVPKPAAIGITPMGIKELNTSSLDITVSQRSGNEWEPFTKMKAFRVFQNVPKAMWTVADAHDQQKQLIEHALCGVELFPPDRDNTDGYKIENFNELLHDWGVLENGQVEKLTWEFEYPRAGASYEPLEIVKKIKTHPPADRYTLVQQLQTLGWFFNETFTEAALNSVYHNMEFRDPPVECLVGQNPQVKKLERSDRPA